MRQTFPVRRWTIPLPELPLTTHAIRISRPCFIFYITHTRSVFVSLYSHGISLGLLNAIFVRKNYGKNVHSKSMHNSAFDGVRDNMNMSCHHASCGEPQFSCEEKNIPVTSIICERTLTNKVFTSLRATLDYF